MQTERVTFLTSPDHKAALDAYAARTGQSVGSVVREATSSYIAQPHPSEDEQAVLDALADELEGLIPAWNARLDRMDANLDKAHKSVRTSLARAEAALR